MSGYHEEDIQTLPCGCTLNVLLVDKTHHADGPPFHVKLSDLAPPEEELPDPEALAEPLPTPED